MEQLLGSGRSSARVAGGSREPALATPSCCPMMELAAGRVASEQSTCLGGADTARSRSLASEFRGLPLLEP